MLSHFSHLRCISQCVQKITDKAEGMLVIPLLADLTVLLKANENDKGAPINNTSQHKEPCSSERLKRFVDSSSKDRVDGLSCVKERFLKEGLSNESTNIIMASWRKSTSIKYQVYINQCSISGKIITLILRMLQLTTNQIFLHLHIKTENSTPLLAVQDQSYLSLFNRVTVQNLANSLQQEDS